MDIGGNHDKAIGSWSGGNLEINVRDGRIDPHRNLPVLVKRIPSIICIVFLHFIYTIGVDASKFWLFSWG